MTVKQEVLKACLAHRGVDRASLNHVMPWPYKVYRYGRTLAIFDVKLNKLVKALGKMAEPENYQEACAKEIIEWLEANSA